MTFKPRLLSLIALITIFSLTKTFGQVPVITHVDKYVTSNGQMVTITGANFGTTPADLVVWFGAAKGDIQTATDKTIEVLAPAGATLESITVTNTATGKSARSESQYMLSYSGTSPIAIANLTAQTDLDAEAGLYDICMCDLDGNGLNDVVASNSDGGNGISAFRNTGSPGTFSFAKVPLLGLIKALNIKCADLNGDGKKELIVTEVPAPNRVAILQNNSTAGSLSFALPIFITITKGGNSTSPKRIEVADLDGDGSPELILSDQNQTNKDVIILPNTSSGATISFGAPTFFAVPGNGTDGLAIQDMDGDNKHDIIVSSPALSSVGNVYVLRNESYPGTFVFNTVVKADISPSNPSSTGGAANIRISDIDGDSKPDIAVTRYFAASVVVLRNTTSGSSISFDAPVSIPTDLFPFGLDAGDLDGDKKPDLVVASLTGSPADPNPKSLSILSNTSTPGNVSFTANQIKATTYINRHVVVGDLDNDAKPDIAYTSVDDGVRGVTASKISFFRNKSCIVPEITPGGTLVVCTSFPLTLEATKSAGATYAWKEGGTANGVTAQTFAPSVPGNYIITVDVTSDGCTRTSNAVDFTVGTGTASTPTIVNNSPQLCVGGTIDLDITPVGGNTYDWTGPEGFTFTGPNPTRPSYVKEFAGRYEVQVFNNGCLAAKGSTLVETVALKSFNVTFTGSDVICTGDTKQLNIAPNDPDYTYEWQDANGNPIGTGPSKIVSATGAYSVEAKSTLFPACPAIETEPVDILLAATPGINFISPAETCKDVVTIFTNSTTAEEDADPQYKWDFGDGNTSTEKSPTHTYTALAASLTVKLTVSYRGDACAGDLTKQIKVSAPPNSATITTPDGQFEFCNGEQITLGVSGTFAKYLWSTNEETNTINVTTGGTYTVDAENSIGCKLHLSQKVDVLPAPPIEITAEKNPINPGESTKLSATSGYNDYVWTPADGLDDATSQTPIATPPFKTEYTVTVIGPNGCPGTAKLLLDVILDNPTNLLKIANFFSPNGDLSNPYWSVTPEAIAKTCGVTIFDEKGVKVFEAKPYNNDWDGTSNGKKLPDGVYYYTIRCDGDSGSKTGSITILR